MFYFQLIHFTMGLRMSWPDPRIIVNLTEAEDYAHLYRDQRHKFWLPDLFLLNSVDVKVSKMILPPVEFKIFKNGMVEFAIREELQAVCPMNMINYPVSISDTQQCRYHSSNHFFLLKISDRHPTMQP